jgi:prephenate dehydrogenase
MKVAVIGFSRFGQLWAEIFNKIGEVTIFSRSDKSALAKSRGYNYFSIDKLDQLSNMDVIFLAVSIDSTENLIKNISEYVNPGAIVMDVCSVKELPCGWLKTYLPKGVQSMGTHPMFGPDSYKSGLHNTQIVLCPVSISLANQNKISDIFSKIGLKVIVTSPTEHDKQVAYSLAMVHLIGRTLDTLPLNNIEIKSLGFERLMKIHETVSNDSWDLFINMYKYNPYAISAMDDFTQNLKLINKKIAEQKS